MKLIFELVVQDVNVTSELQKQRQLVKELTKELQGIDPAADGFDTLVTKLADAKVAVVDLTQQQKELNKEFKSAQLPTDSLAGLRVEYSKLTDQIARLSKTERESDAGKALIQNAANIKSEINGVQESVGNFTGNVGNYKGAILSASDALGVFGGTLGNQAGILQTASTVFDTAKSAATGLFTTVKAGAATVKENVSSFQQYLKILKESTETTKTAAVATDEVADAVEGVADGGVEAGKGLAESAKGAKLFSAAGNVLGLVLKSLGIGLVIALVVGLIGVFQRFAPVIEFVERVVAGLSASFDVLVSRTARLVGAFGKFFSGDFTGAFNDASDAVSGVGSAMAEAAVAAAELKGEMQDLEDAQKDFTLTTAKAEAAVARLSVALKDKTKSDSERLKIAAEITKIETGNLATKTALIDKELDIEKRRLLLTKQITQEQVDQIAGGNFTLARQLEDEFKLESDQADRIRELLIQRTQAEGESATLLERIENRKNAILDAARAKQEAAAAKAAAAADKANKALEAQIARINELQKSIRDLDASTIVNDFDRQSVEIENKRADALAKVAAARELLTKKIAEQKGFLTAADQKELDLISEQTASIVASYDEQQKQVRANRERAVEEQLADLAALSADVAALTEANAQKLVEAEQQILNSNFAQQQAELLAVLNERKKALTKQLLDGSISQKKFKDEYLAAQEAFNIGSLDLERKRAADTKRINDELEAARIAAARATLSVRLAAIDADFQAEIASIRAKAIAQGSDPSERIAAAELKFAELRKTAELDFEDQVRAAKEATKNAQIAAAKDVNAADAQVHADKLARLEEEKEKRRELQQAALDAASTIAGAVFEIERNRIDNQLKVQTDALDAEFAKRREAAAGNQIELEKIDAQYQKRKDALEKEAARKRKRLAITEAIIQGALAVVKSLPNLILAAITAVATAAQIAVINSQTFAAGGIAAFKKSGMFGGRRHSQGGTRGRFDDGTNVEVEKDEVFIILNRRASKQINQLSEFNHRHGGRRFDTGGALDFTPQFAVPGESSGQQIIVLQSGFTDEQVAFLAGEMANQTSAKTKDAVIAGLDERNRTAERQKTLEANSEV